MKLHEISLPSIQGFRPKPAILNTHDGKILLIVTCWGDYSSAEKAISYLLKTLEEGTNSNREEQFDPDVTRIGLPLAKPGPTQSRHLGQIMHQALQKLNDFLLASVNQEKWKTCFEVTLIGHDQQNLYWAQVGQPQVFRSTEIGVEPLSYIPDLTIDFDQKIPLPFQAVGLESEIQIQTGLIPFGKTQKLILLSTPKIPGGLYISMGISLDSIVELIQQNFPDSPAWAGVIDFQLS